MGALRNFCRNASPFRCRNGLLVLPKEVARSDIVRSRQITLMALPCLERTHAVVLRVSCDRTRAVVGKLRRVPGADATNANAAPMRLVLHHLLDIFGPPVMQPLPLGAPFSTRKIAVLHDDDVNLEFIRKLHDEVCRLDGNVLVDTIRSRPKPRRAFCTVALSFPDAPQGTFQRVLLYRQLLKTSADDSAF